MQNKTFEFQMCRAELWLERVQSEYLVDARKLDAVYCATVDPVPLTDWGKLEYRPIRFGECWNGDAPFGSGYFVLSGKFADASAGRTAAVRLNFSGELLVADMNGVCRCGLTCHSVFEPHYQREYHRISDLVAADGSFSFRVEASANHLFGLQMPPDRLPPETSFRDYYHATIRHLEYGRFDEERYRLGLDAEVLLSLAKTLNGHRQIRVRRIVAALARAIDVYAEDPANSAAARAELAPELARRADASALHTTAVGHAHIDTGWLWPVRETVRKCARTYASQLDLIARYPDYVFGASAPQHFAFLKEHYPELYARVKAAVKAGRIEPQGGMWVEADTNLISGESLIRQFLHGKNFFRDEFGVEVKNLWIPDVFGYSGALPQIIRKCRCNFFLTQKLSWNKYNTFPHNTFRWIGIDGSEVVTHFPPENTYNSKLLPDTLIPAGERYVENDFLTDAMSLFGVGDGGGGPKEESIEFGLRQRDLEGSPRVEFGTAEAFFAQVLARKDRLASWHGELYFEMHRGTYTTQALVKKMNRKNEFALTSAEMLWSVLPAAEYPAAEFDTLWKTLLLNQFHDILPGSSIKLVYDRTHREHAEISAACRKLMRQAAEKLFASEPDALTVVNLLSSPVRRSFALPEGWRAAERGDGGAAVSADGYAMTEIPPFSAVVLRKKAGEAAPVKFGAPAPAVLENDLVRYEFDANGALISALDRETGRSLLVPGGRGNVFTLYTDMPNVYDAWDIDEFYRDRPTAAAQATASARFDTPVRQTLRLKLAIGGSSIEQTVSLDAGSKMLRFDTKVDWREEHRMLRVAFETALTRVDEADFDIQYGFLSRPAHVNTSWDAARFESCAHRYADLSDADGGIALLNDCKYGYFVRDGVLDLALLRSPRHPDHTADVGEHFFTYALLPHAGTLIGSEVMDRAAELNRPPLVFAGLAGAFALPFKLAGDGVLCEAVKKAEKSDDLIVRLVEKNGRRGHAALEFAKPATAAPCDMLEWEDLAPAETGTRFEFDFTPFEIKTLRVKR